MTNLSVEVVRMFATVMSMVLPASALLQSLVPVLGLAALAVGVHPRHHPFLMAVPIHHSILVSDDDRFIDLLVAGLLLLVLGFVWNRWFPMNKSLYGARGHWTASGQLQGSTIKACSACHDQHGSNVKKLLGVYDGTGINKINGASLTATTTYTDNQAVCNACHTARGLGYPVTTPVTNPVTLASILTQEGYRSVADNGYFSPTPSGTVATMRWPGKATWDCTVLSSHNVATAAPYFGGRPTGDCNTCHDAHGTAYHPTR